MAHFDLPKGEYPQLDLNQIWRVNQIFSIARRPCCCGHVLSSASGNRPAPETGAGFCLDGAERLSNAHALRCRGGADLASSTEAARRKGTEAVRIAASGNQVGDQAGSDRRQSEAEMTMTEGMDHPGAAT